MLASSSSPPLLLPSLKNYKNTPRITNNGNRIIITCCSSSSTDPLTSLGRLLWGPSLPPHLLISAARTAWSATWHLMMRQLAPSSSSSYTRPSSQFPTVPSPYYSHPTNLTLYAALPCPWAHRALILLALRNPSPSSISLSVATPALDGAWEVEEEMGGRITKLKEVYGRRRGGYSGRATVPMLWDTGKGEVVCNESYGIIQFLNSANFKGREEEEEEEDGGERLDLAPEELRGEIERWNGIIYPNVNNGVYR